VAITSRLGRKKDKPPSSPDGRMTLAEHLRELRNRILVACVAIMIGGILGWVFYDQIQTFLLRPFNTTIARLAKEQGLEAEVVINNGVAGAFLLRIKVSLVAGLVISSPVWLYELWAFILPGLHRNEKKWTYVFVAVAGPLFAAGVVLGYYVMPKGMEVLLGFTPSGITNLIDVEHYLSFVIRVLLVFGVSFEIPLFVVLLNLAGVVRARQLSRWRSWIIFGVFVFAAVATPSTDPITMILLAIPMTVLFLISEVIAHLVDRRRYAGNEPDYADFDDDDVSPI
jgi:sec-independent protein translocase protein TatC